MTDNNIELPNECYDCGHSQHECMKSKPQCKKDIEWCHKCGCGFDWALLCKVSKYVLTTEQRHPWGSTTASEIMVAGFVCPECGEENEF